MDFEEGTKNVFPKNTFMFLVSGKLRLNQKHQLIYFSDIITPNTVIKSKIDADRICLHCKLFSTCYINK